ncbi:hypothetical protein GN956_G24497 [Arapaima gigas]
MDSSGATAEPRWSRGCGPSEDSKSELDGRLPLLTVYIRRALGRFASERYQDRGALQTPAMTLGWDPAGRPATCTTAPFTIFLIFLLVYSQLVLMANGQGQGRRQNGDVSSRIGVRAWRSLSERSARSEMV